MSPSYLGDKSPFRDVTNVKPTAAMATGSPRKSTKSRTKRSNSITHTPQRRSTRLNSAKMEPIETEIKVEEPPEEPQTVRTTRSRRKVTPAGGSIGNKKRGARKENQEGSIQIGRRTRRSISTVPSSPLASRSSPQPQLSTPERPRLTRSSSMSSRAETDTTETQKMRISVINESALEANNCNSPNSRR